MVYFALVFIKSFTITIKHAFYTHIHIVSACCEYPFVHLLQYYILENVQLENIKTFPSNFHGSTERERERAYHVFPFYSMVYSYRVKGKKGSAQRWHRIACNLCLYNVCWIYACYEERKIVTGPFPILILLYSLLSFFFFCFFQVSYYSLFYGIEISSIPYSQPVVWKSFVFQI